jgi:hypothetical protein
MTTLQKGDGKQKGPKLYVDDIRNAPDESWTVARTVNAAINAIAKFDFDEISLDHDISHQVSVGSLSRPYPCEETFQAVAYFIGEKYKDAAFSQHDPDPSKHSHVPKIYIHSSNPVAADSMDAILAGYGLSTKATLGKAANRLEMEIN